jgi:hypothetical protein
MRKRMRLDPKHPFAMRLAKAFMDMEEAGIRVYIHNAGTLTVVDMRDDYREYELNDLEGGGSNCPSPHEIPPIFDYKLNYEKEVDDGEDPDKAV